MEFKAKMVNGIPQIEAVAEEITNPDGSKSVIIHAPSLSLLSDFQNKLNQKEV